MTEPTYPERTDHPSSHRMSWLKSSLIEEPEALDLFAHLAVCRPCTERYERIEPAAARIARRAAARLRDAAASEIGRDGLAPYLVQLPGYQGTVDLLSGSFSPFDPNRRTLGGRVASNDAAVRIIRRLALARIRMEIHPHGPWAVDAVHASRELQATLSLAITAVPDLKSLVHAGERSIERIRSLGEHGFLPMMPGVGAAAHDLDVASREMDDAYRVMLAIFGHLQAPRIEPIGVLGRTQRYRVSADLDLLGFAATHATVNVRTGILTVPVADRVQLTYERAIRAWRALASRGESKDPGVLRQLRRETETAYFLLDAQAGLLHLPNLELLRRLEGRSDGAFVTGMRGADAAPVLPQLWALVLNKTGRDEESVRAFRIDRTTKGDIVARADISDATSGQVWGQDQDVRITSRSAVDVDAVDLFDLVIGPLMDGNLAHVAGTRFRHPFVPQDAEVKKHVSLGEDIWRTARASLNEQREQISGRLLAGESPLAVAGEALPELAPLVRMVTP